MVSSSWSTRSLISPMTWLMRSARLSVRSARNSAISLGPLPSAKCFSTSLTARNRRRWTLTTLSFSDQSRIATISTGSAPGLRLTPRKLTRTPSSTTRQRGRVSSASNASMTTSESPLSSRNQSCAANSFILSWNHTGRSPAKSSDNRVPLDFSARPVPSK